MAVVSVEPDYNANVGQDALAQQSTRVTARYIVTTDDPLDGATTVLADNRLPSLGTSYQLGNDSEGLPLRSRRARRPDNTNRLLWYVDLEYSSQTEAGELKDDAGNSVEDPTQARDEVEAAFMFQRRPFDTGIWRGIEDAQGNDNGEASEGLFVVANKNTSLPILHASHDPVIPAVEDEVALMVIRQIVYIGTWDNRFNKYANAINTDLITIADTANGSVWGPFQPYQVWCSNLSAERFLWEDSQVIYRRVAEYTIQEEGKTWRHYEPNLSLNRRALGGIDPDDGEPPATPILPPDAGLTKPPYRPIYDKVNNEPISEPVWTDKEGSPLATYTPTTGTYFVWSLKPELAMQDFINNTLP